MDDSSRLQSFAEDLEVFRQLTTPEERAEFTGLMKRAYSQHLSACALVQRSPERRVSVRIRRLCEEGLSRDSAPVVHNIEDNPAAASEDGTNFSSQNQL